MRELLEELRVAIMETDRDCDYPLIDRIDAALAAPQAAPAVPQEPSGECITTDYVCARCGCPDSLAASPPQGAAQPETPDEREAFEKWWVSSGFEKFKDTAFAAWQARALLAAPAPAAQAVALGWRPSPGGYVLRNSKTGESVWPWLTPVYAAPPQEAQRTDGVQPSGGGQSNG